MGVLVTCISEDLQGEPALRDRTASVRVLRQEADGQTLHWQSVKREQQRGAGASESRRAALESDATVCALGPSMP